MVYMSLGVSIYSLCPLMLPCAHICLHIVSSECLQKHPSSSPVPLVSATAHISTVPGLSRVPLIGYIGGAVLARLLNHPNRDAFAITALVRSPEKAKTLRDTFGVKAIVGTHDEHDKIEKLAEDSHVIFHLVRFDNVFCML